MKGLLLIPKRFENNQLVSRYFCLFNLIKDKLGFDVIFADDYDVNKIEYDIVTIFKSPQVATPNVMKSLTELPRNVKLIAYYTDIVGSDRLYLRNLEKMLIRADKILCSYDYAFKKRWNTYVNKYEFFPQFFAPFEYYKNLGVNAAPIMKCLLSGYINGSYPLRQYIDTIKHKDVIKLEHPGYESSKFSTEHKFSLNYADELHRHFCCVATSSVFNIVVSKYSEIPASGSLLLATYTPDLDKLGFIDGEHYVAVTKENFFEVLDDVLKNRDKYEQILHAGRKYVLENFSELNRFEQFKRIVEELMGESI